MYIYVYVYHFLIYMLIQFVIKLYIYIYTLFIRIKLYHIYIYASYYNAMILVGLTPPRCFLLNIFTWGFFSESSWHPGGVPRRWWVCSSPFAVLAAVQGFGSNQVPLKSGDVKKMYRDLGYLVTYRQSRGQVCTYEHIYIYIYVLWNLWLVLPTHSTEENHSVIASGGITY